MDIKLLACTENALDVIERAGRTCYKSKGGDRGKFIRKRISEGHLSIIEHASATFKATGISRACSHQLVRHRLASYSQESQRYVELNDDEDWYVIPPEIDKCDDRREIFTSAMNDLSKAYRDLRELGVRKEDARFVLPNATKTTIVLTMNFRTLLHLFSVRISKYAQWEIRDMCKRMLDLLSDKYQEVFSIDKH